jgi:hypothetical protein
MKRFLIFISFLANVILIGGIAFLTVSPTGKKLLKEYGAKIVDIDKTTPDTDSEKEAEENGCGLTKEASIQGLKNTYNRYQKAIAINSVGIANYFADSYAALAEDSKKTWKDFASLMKTEGLPEALPKIG